MATNTTNTGIEKPTPGGQNNTWGGTLNDNFDLIDQMVGVVSITLSTAGTSGSPNDLPITNSTLSDGRNMDIVFTDGGDLGATAYVQLTPNTAEKVCIITNSLSGSQDLIVFQGTYNASNDITIPAGTTVIASFDGAGSGAVVTARISISSYALTLLDDTSAADVRTTLDVDVSGTDNSTAATLVTTSHDYLSLAGQAITLGPIDLAADVTGVLPTANIADEAVTLAKMAHMATASFLGRTTGGTGDVEVLTAAQATALLNDFDTASTTSGLAPGSNSADNTNFLRADGSWATPPGTGTTSNSYETWTVTGTDVGYTWADTGSALADSGTDTITIVEGSLIDIDIDAASDAIRISSTLDSELANLTTAEIQQLQNIGLETISAGNWAGIANLSGTNTGDESAASQSAAGVVEIATNAEANAGSSTALAVCPANLAGYTGSGQINTVGTITAGAWTGTTIAVANGGTGATAAADAAHNLIDNITLTAATVGSSDLVLIQDADGGKVLKTATAQSIANLGSGGDVSQGGSPADSQVAIWTAVSKEIEGDAAFTFDTTSDILNVGATNDGTISVGGTNVINNSAGTMQLLNINFLDSTTEATIETQIDTLSNLTSAGSLATVGTITSGTWQGTTVALNQGGTGATTAAGARTALELGSAALVATDLANLNEATIEAAIDTLANLTSIQGRTVTLADAGADAIFGWDDTANAYENLTAAEVRAVINVADGADVTSTANVTTAGALMDTEVDADIKTLSLPANVTIGAYNSYLNSANEAAFKAAVNLEIGTDVAAPLGTDKQTFTSSDTWTKPAGVTWVRVECIGGGGGGANDTTTTSTYIVGGGGGGFAAGIFLASELGATETVTIGAGGAGGVNGVDNDAGDDGGDSTFGAHLTGRGGGGGSSTYSGVGFGGIGGGGERGGRNVTYYPYAQGGYSSGSGGTGVNVGGNCVMGGAGGGGATSDAAGGSSVHGGDGGAGNDGASVAGTAGTAPGGGGGGSANDGGGGAGADGQIIVWSW